MGISKVQLVENIQKADRTGRYPRHFFNVESMPFSVQPISIAPVLPGETLKNLFMEARVITQPIANSIIGWKKDYFFFYVKATDLLQDAIRNMFADPNNTDLSATLGEAANDQKYYTAKGGVPYLKLAIDRVTETYFRDQGELAETWQINGYPAAQIREGFWLDSLTDKDDMPEGAALATAADAGDLERLMFAFEQLRALGLANMDYEDYLKAHGISVQDEDNSRPELIHHFSDFQYPSNTINPTDGTPSSAVSWVFRNGLNGKPKRFKEPGFIIGLTVTRPKVYFTGLAGNLAAHMSRSWDWLPAWFNDAPQTALKRFDAATGALGDRTTDVDAHFVDMRDLLIHGDQFQNRNAFAVVPVSVPIIHGLPLPDATLNWKYPTEAMVKSFFKDSATAGKQTLWEDGYVSLNISGFQKDMTRGNIAVA